MMNSKSADNCYFILIQLLFSATNPTVALKVLSEAHWQQGKPEAPAPGPVWTPIIPWGPHLPWTPSSLQLYIWGAACECCLQSVLSPVVQKKS